LQATVVGAKHISTIAAARCYLVDYSHADNEGLEPALGQARASGGTHTF